jgi:hypothetical protein
MPTIWDLLPASLWPTQPFIPPVNSRPDSGWSARRAPAPWEATALIPDYIAPDAMASWPSSALPDTSFGAPSQLGPDHGPDPAVDDRNRQMLADAKRAYDFVMWHFGQPSRDPLGPARPPQEQPPAVPRKSPKPPDSIESAPLGPPIPPDGYNEWDKPDQFYEDSELFNVDPGIIARNPDPYRTLDGSMVIDPENILTLPFHFRKRAVRRPTRNI